MSSLEHASARAASEQDRILAAQPLPSSDDILAGIGRRRRALDRKRTTTALAGALVLLFAIAFGLRGRSSSAPASSVVATASDPALGVARAVDARKPLVFPDGTTIVLMPGATADLREVHEHGATLLLEDGTLNVDVVHAPTSAWQINAGPFGILVTGTKFDVTWDLAGQRLTVAMTEGTVRVTGPCVNEPLAAPNHKVFTCVPAPPVVIARPSVAAPVATERPRLEQTATTLFAAAEHARLAGAEADARRLYGAVRERFPGTDEAGKSAFLLGRMSDASGASDDAVRWFGLAAEERGGLATAALGRLIELEQKRGNGSRARSLAAHYLEKHPDGPHAAYAASIVEAHP